LTMKRVLLFATTLCLLVLAVGCQPMQHRGARGVPGSYCGPGMLGGQGGPGGRICDGLVSGKWARNRATDRAAEEGPPGPPTAAVAYPYYTLRGPRDFLVDNPPSIGR
jgi:hypothetical protein